MANEISVACSPGPMVSAEIADGICGELRAYLAERFPQYGFIEDAADRTIAVTVTKANERSLGLEVVWMGTNGLREAGTPLSTAFYDRNSDEMLRRRFFEVFLQQNPLPF
jgi:hypothetical protein